MTTANITEIIGSGFQTWKKNISICIPMIIGMILCMVVAIGIMLPTVFTTFRPIIQEAMTNSSAMQSPEMTNRVLTLFLENIWLFICTIVVIAIVCGFIVSFFTAGTIGMAKEAILTGKTNLSHMMSYGKKKFLSYFGASVIVGLVMLVGVLFLIPGIISLLAHSDEIVSQTPLTSAQLIPIMLPFIGGIILMVLYILPMSLILMLVPYAVVIDDISSVEGFRKGIRVVWHNKASTFLLWLFMIVVAVIIGFISMIPLVGSLLMLTIMFLVFMPLVTIWWTKLYLTVTKSQENASPAVYPNNPMIPL
jgi:hypothetical protein